MISIIDYDAGNLKSVEKALHYLGEEAVITRDRKTILHSDKIILPGVGSFGVAMDMLRSFELDKMIEEAAAKEIPFLGICLGLQLMFEGSEENEGVEGLKLLPGKILKIPDSPGIKIPHVGWNSLTLQNQGRLFQDISQNSYVYFVHSYYLQAEEEEIVTAVSEYSVRIHASVEKGNLFGCQFHPEKSSEVGIRILNNFAKIGKEV